MRRAPSGVDRGPRGPMRYTRPVLASLLLLAAALPAQTSLVLAPGQAALYQNHVEGFPKAGWVVGQPLALAGSPNLTGRLLEIVPVGKQLEVAGVMQPIAEAGKPFLLGEVLAVPAGVERLTRRAGYCLARGVPVFETLLARWAPDVALFATVVGQVRSDGVRGMVLEVEIWARRGDELPSLVASGPNLPAGPLLRVGSTGGAALELGGVVFVVDRKGARLWRSPAGETWHLGRTAPDGFVVVGPGGERTIRTGTERKKSGGLGARQEEGGGWMRAFRSWP
jgi:hypothetical protein